MYRSIRRILILILCLVSLFAGAAHALPVDSWFRQLSVADGLSSNSVRALLQDSQGFIWIGTDGGPNRYDGMTVQDFGAKEDGLSESVSSFYDTGESIWIGTENGLYVFHPDVEQFAFFGVTTAQGDTIRSNVNHITEDRDGNLWLSTVGQGVFRYAPSTHRLERFSFPSSNDLMACVLVDSENQIWAVTNWGTPALSRLNKVTDSFEPFHLHYEGKTHSSNSLVMLEDSEHNFWLGTWECGLQKVDRYTGRVTTYLHPKDGKVATHIHSMMELAPHQLLVGSDDGLLLFHTQTGQYRLFAEDSANPHALSNRFVYPIIKDKEGGVWIGTYYGGINYLSPNSGQFETYIHSDYVNSLNGSVVGRFCEDKDRGNMWIATDDGGLNCLSIRNKDFRHYLPTGKEHSLSYHNVHALCMDGDNLWIGTYTGGVNVLHIPTGRFRTYTSVVGDETSLDGSSSYAIYRDRESQIWVATMEGINRYDRKNDCFIRLKHLGALTIDIDQDTEGNYWFATEGKGAFCYRPKENVWKQYPYGTHAGQLPSDIVYCIFVDVEGTLWLGTANGLCRYLPAEDRFVTVPLQIPSQHICGIVEDQHVLWLSTMKGLVRYVPGEGCQCFTRSDGLRSEQFLPNAMLKTSDGKVYAGSVNGFMAFYPYQIKSNKVPPSVVITELEVFNRTIPVGHSLLPKSMQHTQRIDLSHRENVFSLSFASLSYCTPEKNQYAYYLEGFDKGWNQVGAQHKATYTNLPAGHYVFRVKATNNDGLWSRDEARLEVVVHPPFYLTVWAKLLYAVICVICLVLLVRYLLYRSERKHTDEINQLNLTKEKEVHEAKIKFFTMIAHEIRTPVSLIIGPLEKIMKTGTMIPAALKEDLNVIDRNSQRLLYLVNQLLDFRKVEQEGMKIRFVNQDIEPLLQAVCERFQPFMKQHEATLVVNYPTPGFQAMVDSEAITKLISNLLTNASKYTRDEVVLTCRLQPDRHSFVIEIKDNGIGISAEDQKRIFNPFYQAMDNKPGTGIGLSIVKSIVDLHHGCIEVQSELGVGSIFRVTLPVEQHEGIEVSAETEVGSALLPEDILSESLPVVDTQKPSLLVVDDNEEMLNFLSSTLSGQFTILTAIDGLDALEKLEKNTVSFIVSDWMMPRMDGVQLCQEVRKSPSWCHIPFILLTAKTDAHSKVEGMDCGADAYIEKPFSIQYLEACIKNLLDLRRMLRQKFSKMPLVPINSIASNAIDNQFLTRINQIIEENFSNSELSVDFLAEQLSISRSGLFAKIKTLANVTPNELIQIVRLKKAAVLLSQNQYRISEICYMVGFNNPSYFSKCFQKQFGMKPGEFMASTSQK